MAYCTILSIFVQLFSYFPSLSVMFPQSPPGFRCWHFRIRACDQKKAVREKHKSARGAHTDVGVPTGVGEKDSVHFEQANMTTVFKTSRDHLPGTYSFKICPDSIETYAES